MTRKETSPSPEVMESTGRSVDARSNVDLPSTSILCATGDVTEDSALRPFEFTAEDAYPRPRVGARKRCRPTLSWSELADDEKQSKRPITKMSTKIIASEQLTGDLKDWVKETRQSQTSERIHYVFRGPRGERTESRVRAMEHQRMHDAGLGLSVRTRPRTRDGDDDGDDGTETSDGQDSDSTCGSGEGPAQPQKTRKRVSWIDLPDKPVDLTEREMRARRGSMRRSALRQQARRANLGARAPRARHELPAATLPFIANHGRMMASCDDNGDEDDGCSRGGDDCQLEPEETAGQAPELSANGEAGNPDNLALRVGEHHIEYVTSTVVGDGDVLLDQAIAQFPVGFEAQPPSSADVVEMPPRLVCSVQYEKLSCQLTAPETTPTVVKWAQFCSNTEWLKVDNHHYQSCKSVEVIDTVNTNGDGYIHMWYTNPPADSPFPNEPRWVISPASSLEHLEWMRNSTNRPFASDAFEFVHDADAHFMDGNPAGCYNGGLLVFTPENVELLN